jgi:hypothetical protein
VIGMMGMMGTIWMIDSTQIGLTNENRILFSESKISLSLNSMNSMTNNNRNTITIILGKGTIRKLSITYFPKIIQATKVIKRVKQGS